MAIEFIENKEQFLEWRKIQFVEWEYSEFAPEPNEYPCLASIDVVSWNNEECMAVYTYFNELEQILAKMKALQDTACNMQGEKA